MAPQLPGHDHPEVTEVKRYLDGREKRFACTLVRREPGHVVLRYVSDRVLQVSGLELPLGMVTHGHYWQDRPYNLYHWMRPDGTTLAYYLNVCDRVHWDEAEVAWRDLVVDVLLLPDGSARVLDREELPEGLAPEVLAYVDAAEGQILAARDQLRREAEQDPGRPQPG